METRTSNIGEAAEAIWKVVNSGGAMSTKWASREAGLPESLANEGIGWLAREGKLVIEKRHRGRETRVEKAAAKVWEQLRFQGPMSVGRISEVTGFSSSSVNEAIGWLGREGRLMVEKLESNYQVRVGEAAGAIWRALNSGGPMARADICLSTGLSESMASQGIGWLLREGKLVLEERGKNRQPTVGVAAGSVWRVAHSNWPAFKRRLCSVLGLPGSTGKSSAAAPGGRLSLSSREGREIRIGDVAGTVWQALHSSGPMTKRRLCRRTGLPRDFAEQGIGWLAREDRLVVQRDPKGWERFKLKEAPAF